MSHHFRFAGSDAEALELYLLEALDPPEQSEVAAHLSSCCEPCEDELARSRARVAALALAAPAERPAPAVKRRVLERVQPRHRSSHNLGWSWIWGPAAIALGILCLILLGRLAGLAARGQHFQDELAASQRQTQQALAQERDLRLAASLEADPATLALPVRAGPGAPQGRVYLNPARGAVIVATRLPPAPAGHIYEMWLLPAHGNPVPAGLFQSSSAGDAVHALAQPLHDITGAAISVEPAGGSAQPTGAIVLAAKRP